MTIIASLLLLAGLFCLRFKKRAGFILQVLGSGLMIIHFAFFLFPIDWAIIVMNAIFALASGEAWFKWRKDGSNS